MVLQLERIIVSGNCYWCVEALYQTIKGCESVIPGFFHFKESFCDIVGKVEAVQIGFDNEIISLKEILEVFFVTHNPSLVNWTKSECIFPLNRSCIIFNMQNQEHIARLSIESAKDLFNGVVHTKVINENQGKFLALEKEKWSFYLNNPKDGYCTSIINPKINALRKKLSYLMVDTN